MTRISIRITIAMIFMMVLCLTSYGQGTDAYALGVKGHVKRVITQTYTASQAGDHLVKGQPVDEGEEVMTFDRDGRVTLDPFGNQYSYDERGRFVRGTEPYSRMSRDEDGRIDTYEHMRDDEDVDGFGMECAYDEQGRLIETAIQFWEWSHNYQYTYEDDHVYPEREVFEFREYENVTRVTRDFRYTKFDDRGNWTEREVHVVSIDIEEPDDEDTPPRVGEPATTYEVEMRNITYY
ncbi:MAG: hypothetical protein J6I72_06865 [Muribaculaceae bacterium]|nr:hypothetical protein [Muribaculaceae bacterium]